MNVPALSKRAMLFGTAVGMWGVFYSMLVMRPDLSVLILLKDSMQL